jgi:hypothetical protein
MFHVGKTPRGAIFAGEEAFLRTFGQLPSGIYFGATVRFLAFEGECASLFTFKQLGRSPRCAF